METYGPDDRELFESDATALYEAVVDAGELPSDDPRIQEGGEWHAALRQLRDLGLLRFDPSSKAWLPEDPGLAQPRVVSPLSQQGVRLLDESSQWARAFGVLNQAWRRAAASSSRAPFTYMHGGPTINAFLHSLVPEAEEEVLTAQPQTGRDVGALLQRNLQEEGRLLGRGVKLKTLYQHSARRSTATREYVAAVTELGAEVRTLDEFFNRMIVVDRRTAVIPAPSDLSTALVIREPTVVAYLVDVFMRSWERARPFTSREASVVKQIAEEQRAMTMRMLIEGHSDPVSAKRLGVSQRTYAGYVADLKEEFDAETRFQLGYTIGRLGLTGSDVEAAEEG